MAKLTKDELLKSVREHGGETPDDFTVKLLEDITDSFEEFDVDALVKAEQDLADMTKARDELQVKYDALHKSYADRFVITDKGGNDDANNDDKDKTPEVTTETFDSIF